MAFRDFKIQSKLLSFILTSTWYSKYQMLVSSVDCRSIHLCPRSQGEILQKTIFIMKSFHWDPIDQYICAQQFEYTKILHSETKSRSGTSLVQNWSAEKILRDCVKISNMWLKLKHFDEWSFIGAICEYFMLAWIGNNCKPTPSVEKIWYLIQA